MILLYLTREQKERKVPEVHSFDLKIPFKSLKGLKDLIKL